ncbi:heme-degrading domain-containing protein [Paenarthrobacter sp. GOM3]|uniref:heme-degrading domain-containing protein n=1 Tax=Paenarthrobacter sp. GOM3 TaxID=2782567 RepID=UPI001BAA90A8|nr:heme-degrading domain-containing protein [Paenarthrobacter sp. GOM3]WOH19347.1 heme-degrading domain-containing protein [Paenarthrobacter sp. GOM3]
MSDSPRLAELRQQEEELVFAAFDHHDAWRLGSLIANHALSAGLGVAIDIRRHNIVLFRCVLPGATSDQEEWIRRKSASVLRFEHSTALLTEQFAERDPLGGGWLAPEDYTLAGGSFPIRVRGVGVIGAITVSGLSSDDDHQLVVDGIRNYLKTVG